MAKNGSKRPLTRSQTGGELDIDLSFYPEDDPSKRRRGSMGSIIAMRTRPIGEDTKTAALLTEDSKTLPHTPIKEGWAAIKGDRPIATLGTPTPVKGRPSYILTPGGSRLNRDRSYGFVLFFSNNATEAPAKSDASTSLPSASPAPLLDKIKTPPKEAVKSQSAYVTAESLEESRIERVKLKHRRPISQQKAVAAKGTVSAADYSQMIGIAEEFDKWEWLHLIAWMIQGTKGQKVENLVGGIDHANTDMVFAESNVPKIAQHFPDGLKLDVTATLIPRTHIAKTVTYKISNKEGFSLTFEFDAQERSKPLRTYRKYIDTVIDEMLKITQEHISRAIEVEENITSPEGETKENTPSANPLSLAFSTPKKPRKSYLDAEKIRRSKTAQKLDFGILL